MRGRVFNIQRFTTNDGPGIRTTVFLKGCPLNCLWCHNPESKSPMPELSLDAKRCIGCGKCAVNCPKGNHILSAEGHRILRENCDVCGYCAKECPGGALERIGKDMDAAEVIEQVMRDKPFFQNSDGGMTVSGGEPLFQPDFLLELLTLARQNGIRTAIETSGFSAWKNLERLIPVTDFFLFDIKETDAAKHLEYTAVPMQPIHENLRRLDAAGACIILRCPLIPDYNVRDEHFIGIANIANSLKNVLRIELEPYHPLGASKARNIGKEYAVANLDFPAPELSKTWVTRLQALTPIPVRLA